MLTLDQAAIDAGTTAMASESAACEKMIQKMQLDTWANAGTYQWVYGDFDAYNYTVWLPTVARTLTDLAFFSLK